MKSPTKETSNTQLNGRRLAIARAAWFGIFLIDVFFFLVSVPVWRGEMLQDPYQVQAGLSQIGLSIEFFAYYGTVLQVSLAGALILLALVIYWRKSDDWLGLLVSAGQLSLLVGLPVIHALPRADPAWYYPILLVRISGMVLAMLVFYLFPDGIFVPIWTSWLAMICLVYLGAWIIFPPLIPPATPIEIHNSSQALTMLLVLLWVGSGVFAQFYRYRRVSNPLQRQQTKWVVFGFIAIFTGLALIVFPPIFIPSLHSPGIVKTVYLLFEIPFALFAIFLLPLSIGISILRYHLWDIDILIRRTLVYAVLTTTLAAAYFGSVLLLQGLFQIITGQYQSPIATVISTLTIAALFTPLRRQVQNFIDRRFYRRKYNAERALEDFAATARSETDLENLSSRLVALIQETFQPESTSLWLRLEGIFYKEEIKEK